MDNSKFEIEQKTYIPLNDIYIGYYSPSRRRVEPETTWNIVKEGGRSRTVLTFGSGFVPSVYDYKIARAEQYIFQQNWSIDAIEADAKQVFPRMIQSYLQSKSANEARQRRNKQPEPTLEEEKEGDQLLLPIGKQSNLIQFFSQELTELQMQEITLMVMRDLSNRYFIEYTGPEIELILGNGEDGRSRQTSRIKRSKYIRSNTLIQEGTTFYLGGSTEKTYYETTPTPLAYIDLKSQKNQVTKYITRFNPFLLFNLISRRVIDFDIKTLRSYRDSIAILLAEYLYVKFFGTIIHYHEFFRIGYKTLCDQLLLVPQPNKSLAKRQFREAFRELEEKHIVEKVEFEMNGGRGIADADLHFYPHDKLKGEILDKLAQSKKNPFSKLTR